MKVKCELNQVSVLITLYMKLNVHSSSMKQFIVLEVGDRWTDGVKHRMTTIGIRQNLAEA